MFMWYLRDSRNSNRILEATDDKHPAGGFNMSQADNVVFGIWINTSTAIPESLKTFMSNEIPEFQKGFSIYGLSIKGFFSSDGKTICYQISEDTTGGKRGLTDSTCYMLLEELIRPVSPPDENARVKSVEDAVRMLNEGTELTEDEYRYVSELIRSRNVVSDKFAVSDMIFLELTKKKKIVIDNMRKIVMKHIGGESVNIVPCVRLPSSGDPTTQQYEEVLYTEEPFMIEIVTEGALTPEFRRILEDRVSSVNSRSEETGVSVRVEFPEFCRGDPKYLSNNVIDYTIVASYDKAFEFNNNLEGILMEIFLLTSEDTERDIHLNANPDNIFFIPSKELKAGELVIGGNREVLFRSKFNKVVENYRTLYGRKYSKSRKRLRTEGRGGTHQVPEYPPRTQS